MWLIAFIVLQGLAIWSGVRQEERAGLYRGLGSCGLKLRLADYRHAPLEVTG